MMKRYVIVNEKCDSIMCKVKKGGRHYRQHIGDIEKGLVIIKTTKGRAERERDYLNTYYQEGWEIQEVDDEKEL